MLRAGYIIGLLEKLPYDTEEDFTIMAGPETEFTYIEAEDTRQFWSDREKVVVRDNGVTVLLECGM